MRWSRARPSPRGSGCCHPPSLSETAGWVAAGAFDASSSRLVSQRKRFSAACSGEGETPVFLAVPAWVGNGACVTRGTGSTATLATPGISEAAQDPGELGCLSLPRSWFLMALLSFFDLGAPALSSASTYIYN